MGPLPGGSPRGGGWVHPPPPLGGCFFPFKKNQQKGSQSLPILRAEKTMTATDVTGFDAIFSTGFFATFSRLQGARLTKLHINTREKAKNAVESLSSRETAPPKLQISVPCRGRTCRYRFSVARKDRKAFWGRAILGPQRIAVLFHLPDPPFPAFFWISGLTPEYCGKRPPMQ